MLNLFAGPVLSNSDAFFIIIVYSLPITIPLVIFFILSVKGHKKHDNRMRTIGLIGLTVMAILGLIYFAFNRYQQSLYDASLKEDTSEFIDEIPPVYAPELTYLSKEALSERSIGKGKHYLYGVLHRNDLYEFRFDFPFKKLRGFKDKPDNRVNFDPSRNICNFAHFFPDDNEINKSLKSNDQSCAIIYDDKNGITIYTPNNPNKNSNYVYYGIIKNGTLMILNASRISSNYQITDIRNQQTEQAISILKSLQPYEKTQLQDMFYINLRLGLTK